MKKIVYISIFILFLAFAGFFTYKYFFTDKSPIVNENKGEPIDLGEGIVAESVETTVSTTTISQLNMTTLDRKITFAGIGSLEAFKLNETKLNGIVKSLKEHPEEFTKWMDLGTYRKIIGDYEGTKEAWENALTIRPKSAIALSNMGNLYGYYLKDTNKAEEYYLASIKSDPAGGFWYYQTFSFYKEVLNDPVKAKNIIEEGVKNSPYDSELKSLLNSL